MRISALRVLATVFVLLGAISFFQTTAHAQSSTPKWYMMDTKPGGAFPGKAGHWTHAANAVVVFGLGSVNCTYTQTVIQNSTTYWMGHDYQVVTNINPQKSCTSTKTIAPYESEIHSIEKDVETTHKNTNPGRYWGGFMLDEEPGFGFTSTQVKSLNTYVRTLMAGTAGLSWYFTEDTVDGWAGSLTGNATTYHKMATGSWLAPQVYNATDANVVNYACSKYSSMCTNDVTINEVATGTWGNYSYVTGKVTGTPWRATTWGTTYWCNEYVYA